MKATPSCTLGTYARVVQVGIEETRRNDRTPERTALDGFPRLKLLREVRLEVRHSSVGPCDMDRHLPLPTGRRSGGDRSRPGVPNLASERERHPNEEKPTTSKPEETGFRFDHRTDLKPLRMLRHAHAGESSADDKANLLARLTEITR